MAYPEFFFWGGAGFIVGEGRVFLDIFLVGRNLAFMVGCFPGVGVGKVLLVFILKRA